VRRLTAAVPVCVLAAACVGTVGDNPLDATPLTVERTEIALTLAAAPGFADERGGGVFQDDAGRAVRLRVDGTQAALESHPGNDVAPGRVLRVLPAGAFSAWIAADNGVYVAEAGWLVEPSWRGAIDPQGLVAAAIGGDGIAWIAHRDGLYHLDGGELAQLTAQGAAIRGITALAVAPAPNGAPAVWFARGKQLSYAEQTARSRFRVIDADLDADALSGGVLALAGVSASPDAPGELWLITPRGLFQHSARGWTSFDTPQPPAALMSAGRFVWLRAGDALYRYDADERRWRLLDSGTAQTPSLLAADATGGAWARIGEHAFALHTEATPRLVGLFEGERVYTPDLQLRARVLTADDPTAVTFSLDDGEEIERSVGQAKPGSSGADTLDFALGGFDAAGEEQTYSLAGVDAGMHTLTIVTQTDSGVATRRVHFDLRTGDAIALSFASDILPIFAARCAKCHASGPGHDLSGYTQWLSEKDSIVRAIVELRMPADGPLDPSQIERIQRWARGDSAP
jgi:hypothetical protein